MAFFNYFNRWREKNTFFYVLFCLLMLFLRALGLAGMMNEKMGVEPQK